MKKRQLTAIITAGALVFLSACGSGSAAPTTAPTAAAQDSGQSSEQQGQTQEGQAQGAPQPGKDTNNGRPYNLTPVKYDSRSDEYLYAINGTQLPITPEKTTIRVWRDFSSTIMQGMDENEAIQELEKRTNVHVEWIYPPKNQARENFSLLVASDDLPDVFSCPAEDAYPGGYKKAVEDGVFAELTPYYDRGLMPNVKWLRENREDINRDIMDDEGKMNFWPMLDMIGSAPWSGLWVRQDWLDELGMAVPTTIDGWTEVMRAMKAAKGVTPLQMNIKDWYGVNINFMFVGAYEASYYEVFNKNGKVVYGSIEPGYKDFLAQANAWYQEGLLDPDFATRTYEDYNANIAAGKVGVCGLAYGEYGQIKLTGQQNDPKFNLRAVPMPVLKDGQTIHLHQNNATTRSGSDRDFMTTRAEEKGLGDIIAKWKDYWYSQDGGDLLSYGPEGLSYQWKADGEVEWIYPKLSESADSDFWTLYPLFKIHNYGYARNSAAYEFDPEVEECIDVWASQPNDWIMPDNISYTADESKEIASLLGDIMTYKEEMTYKFITGQEPISGFEAYVDKLKAMNVDRLVEIIQQALDRYSNRK